MLVRLFTSISDFEKEKGLGDENGRWQNPLELAYLMQTADNGGTTLKKGSTANDLWATMCTSNTSRCTESFVSPVDGKLVHHFLKAHSP